MFNILSLGAGVQSSTLAMMYAKKELGPMPNFAVFADTQAEPESVYTWLKWLKKQLPFPVYTVTKGNLAEDSLKIRTNKKTGNKYILNLVPFYLFKDKKPKGLLIRGCTTDYKINPIIKFIRNKCNIKKGEKEIVVNMLMGISTDEIIRVRDSRVPFIKNKYPLIENNISRNDCLNWFKKNNLSTPPRSACIFCPYHSNSFWRDQRKNHPKDFKKAMDYEKQAKITYKIILENRKSYGKNYDVSLHSSGNLEDFDENESKQLDLFDRDCEGMCGV